MKFEAFITEKKLSKKAKAELVGTAVQIVFEYPNWGQEHVSDMFNLGERLPFTYDDLEDLTFAADKLKKQGSSWEETEKVLMRAKGSPAQILRRLHQEGWA